MRNPTFVSLNPGAKSASELFEQKFAGKIIPLEVMFEVTHKCNLKCVHCYNFDREEGASPNLGAELSSEEILNTIDQVVAAGCWSISFTGGEVLLHPDIYQFIKRAREHNCVVVIKTNGILLNPERVKRLADLGVHNVWVSLYGIDAHTHDAFTTVPSSFEKSVRGCELVLEHGMSLSIACVLTDRNAGQIKRLHGMAEKMGAGFMVTPEITERHDGTDSSRNHLPVLENTRLAFKENQNIFCGPADFDPNRFMQCACARQSCTVASNGDVYPCINAPMKAGNIREASFQSIWDDSPLFARIRGLQPTDFKDCENCEDKPWCARSSGTVYTNTGDYLGADPVTCLQASVRREIWEEEHGPVDVPKAYEEFTAEHGEPVSSEPKRAFINCP